MALTQTQVSELYVSIFGRASEGNGNQFWQAEDSMESAAAAMLATDPAIEYFGDTLNDNQAFIEFIYENTFGKTYAEDPEGVDFWTAALNGGTSKGEIVASLISAVEGVEDGDAAKAQFNNRVEVSNYTADNITEAGDNLDQFKNYINTVTDNAATVTSAKNSVQADRPENPGETFTLTTGINEGTAGDDLFIGTRGTIDGAIVQAGGGIDTLRATVDNANDDGAPVTSSDLEILQLRALDGTAIDLGDASGLEQAWSNRSAGDLTLENAVNTTTFGMSDTEAALAVEISGVSATDTVNVALDTAGIEGDTAQFQSQTAETLSVTTSGGASYFDIDDDTSDIAGQGADVNAFTTVNVAGDQDLDLTVNEEVTTISAADFTGGLTVDMDMASDKTVTSGSGNDSITVSGAGEDTISTGAGDDTVDLGTTLSTDDSIDAGEGEDTLAVTGAGGAVIGADRTEDLLNFETLSVTTGASGDSVDLDNIAVNAVLVTDDGNDFTATNVSDETFTVTATDDATDDSSNSADFTATLADDTGESDSITVTVQNQDEGDDSASDDDRITAALTLDNIETLNIDGTATEDANNKVEIDLTTSTTGTAEQTLNIGGDAVVEFATTPLTSDTINASTNTAGVILNLGNADQTVTGTAEDDSFIFVAGEMDANDTVDGGEGDDTVEVTVEDAATVTSANISNVSTINITATATNAQTSTFDADNVSGNVNYVVDNATVSAGAGSGAETLIVDNITSGSTVTIKGDFTETTNTDANLDLNLSSSTASDVLNIVSEADGATATYDAVTTNSAETINLTVTDDDATAVTTISSFDITGTETLNVTGEDGLVISAFANAGDVATIDLSSMTGGFDLADSGAGATYIVGEIADGVNGDNIDTTDNVSADDAVSAIALTASQNDIVRFTADSLNDDILITGFEAGGNITDDNVDLSAFTSLTSTDDLTFTDGDWDADSTSDDVAITSDGFDGTIYLTGVTTAELNNADFTFA
ncbi:beta strand repeat-containing protein [Hydrogenovibrio halophilus]|uniref:beta strand repeat-containing protein n=1 Tax=Hydrogenovibrio halophilus TaxID=373391 RepID=UPI0003603570|nr:DUF4214 domain-containing protein [Hydrogenovibrio halophilus]